MMGLHFLPYALLVAFLHSLALPLCGKSPPAPGTPLSDSEYQVFFSALLSSQKANMFCQIRRTQGCYDPNIIWLDQHENHGWIPEGSVCTNLPEASLFQTFCEFAQYRCTTRKFYIKRILCPDLPPPKKSPAQAERPHTMGSWAKSDSLALTSPPKKPDSRHLKEDRRQHTDIRLYPHIDAILKYAYAVSGQEPMPKGFLHVMPVRQRTQERLDLPGHLQGQAVTTLSETSLGVKLSTKIERGTKQHIDYVIEQLINLAFSLEGSLDVKTTPVPVGTELDQKGSNSGAQEEVPVASFAGRENPEDLIPVQSDISISRR
ncbi:acrosin-binding protein [Alligator sinensis]|uniref:Acrosin-binding protein n=1 Tax=Alligator sinensis TaxID=38654 RepID=A0A1U8DB83_ALLSI|nr:acrosin-binding protein [Alligator sinensis]